MPAAPFIGNELRGDRRKLCALNEAISSESSFDKPTLFISGERSDYIRGEDLPLIRKLFPRSEFCDIAGAGHWCMRMHPKPSSVKLGNSLSTEIVGSGAGEV